MTQSALRRLVPAPTGLALAAVLAGPATANIVVNAASSTQYSVKIFGLPDFDQRRDMLPNDGGMYCVPTSAMNWMAYLARHGAPGVAPGSQSLNFWQSAGAYPLASLNILNMGGVMDTDSTGGTGPEDAVEGLVDWLSDYPFLIYRQHANEGNPARFGDVAEWAKFRALVIAIVGWYPYVSIGGQTATSGRDGGHALTLAKIQRNGDNRLIGWRDPASDEDGGWSDVQSTFTTEDYAVQPEQVLFLGSGTFRTMDKVVSYGNSEVQGYLDGYYAMVPLFALTTTLDGVTIKKLTPFHFSWDDPSPSQSFTIPGSLAISELLPAAGGPAVYYITTAANRLLKLDTVSGAVSQVMNLTNCTRMAIDGQGKYLYMAEMGGNQLRQFDMTTTPPTLVHTIVPPGVISALTFDDKTKSIVALSIAAKRIYRFSAAMTLQNNWLLPAALALAGDGSVTVNPVDGRIFFTSTGSPAFYRLIPEIIVGSGVFAESIGAGVISQPRGISVGDNGHVFVSSGGVIREFTQGVTGGWAQVTTGPFAGQPAGGAFHFPRSRTNNDPAIHTGPALRNVLPPVELQGSPDCQADIDESGIVNGLDLAALLSAWGTCHGCQHDFDGDGDIDGLDLASFLSAWGPCPK